MFLFVALLNLYMKCICYDSVSFLLKDPSTDMSPHCTHAASPTGDILSKITVICSLVLSVGLQVTCQVKRMTSPGCSSVSVKWQQFNPTAPPPLQAPKQIHALFNDCHTLVYGFVPHCTQVRSLWLSHALCGGPHGTLFHKKCEQQSM